MKYRKKPVVVEAIQYNGKNKLEIQVFMNMDIDKVYKGLIIPTYGGYVFASIGDYIIKGVEGEFYPCKPDIFEKTYEMVGEDK